MHLEALTLEGKKIISKIELTPDFYLAGGTGLALQLGHRISIDFDFFSDKIISADILDIVEKTASDLRLTSKIIVNNQDELTLILGETKLTFLYYPFPVLLSFVDFNKIRVASILEIAAMKAYTLGRRGTFKDYIDIYFIVKNGKSLELIANLAAKKYGDAFDTRLFLEQLIYLKDIKDVDIKFLKERVGKLNLEKFFEEKIRNFPL